MKQSGDIALFTHPAALHHDNGAGHPEAAVRLQAIFKALAEDAPRGLVRREAPRATLDALKQTHRAKYVDRLLGAIPEHGSVAIDSDTTLSPGSGEAALRAAGGACAAVDAVMKGEAARGFVAMRPPGHHAELDRAMGFCLFNNVAVATLHARTTYGTGHIAIVDFDVHHGNGTQDIFWDDPETLFLSVHQSPLYPGSGARDEVGTRNNIVNRPLPPGAGSVVWRKTMEHDILPRIEAFAPKLILVSAGFDAHEEDPLAQMMLHEDDYEWMARRLVEMADRHAEGRVAAVLEGGYNPPALARSVRAFLKGLAPGPG